MKGVFMFELIYQENVVITNVPIQWIPKIELYYPDLPQFPIMYIHTYHEKERLIACPVSVNFEIHGKMCNAIFTVLTNLEITSSVHETIKKEIEDRIGFSKQISRQIILNCCKGNIEYENLMSSLWNYIEMSFGTTIPFGRFYEEIYSIVRFVSAWQPKTGRQSEMRMLYNFMSVFGEEAVFPNQWTHLEYYIIPNYEDVLNSNYKDFIKFKKLYTAIHKIFNYYFTNEFVVENVTFKVMPKAWKQNKDDFIKNVSSPLYSKQIITIEDKFFIEKLVDAFNRHAWRAAYFISAFMNITNTDYRTWSKSFFKTFYDNGNKLKGYSEKVIACFLQQGFGKEEIIPVDTWIETFYRFPLGITDRATFYDSFDNLGKLERVIWLASQSNKTNMKNFFDILWCQRYGVIGNKEFRGINPIACYGCHLKDSCVGLSHQKNNLVLVKNDITEDDFEKLVSRHPNKAINFICILEEDIPKKAFLKNNSSWLLVDEFSGYILTSQDKLSHSLVNKELITMDEFIKK